MAGLLDYLTGNDQATSPWGALYQAPDAAAQDALLKKQAADQANANFLRGLMENPTEGVGNPNPGAGPSAIVNATPAAPPSIFGAVPQIAPAAPPAPPTNPFGAVPQNVPGPSAAPPIAAPFSFGGPGSNVIPPQPPPQAAPPAPAPAPMPAPPQNDPITVGNYQMPRVGGGFPSPADGADSETPANATPTAGQAPAAPAPAGAAPFSLAGIGSRLAAAGQSMHGSGGLIPALFNGATSLASGQRTDAAGVAQNATIQALVAKGAAPAEAQAAVGNPTLMAALVQQYFGKDKFQVVKTKADAFGAEQYRVFNQSDGTFKDAAKGDGENAPGSTTINSALKGDDYLKQFPPEMQSMVKDYIAGKSVPTGNPRRDNIVKQVASKYGEDIGVPVDDATYAARKQMRTQLSSSAPSSLGGQINIGNTAAGHLADLSQRALELGNYDTGIAPLSSVVNNVRGLGTEQAAKMEALKGAAQHYGQEITKFYAGSPGGVAERDRFIESVNGARSPKELAAILATEGELMRSRLDALGGQIKGVLGDEGLKQYPVLRPDGQTALTKVEENVSKLKGGGAPAGGKPATVMQNGHSYSLQPDGTYK